MKSLEGLTLNEKITFKGLQAAIDSYNGTTGKYNQLVVKKLSTNKRVDIFQELKFLKKQSFYYEGKIRQFELDKHYETLKIEREIEKLKREKFQSLKFQNNKKDTSNMTIKELEAYKKEVHSFLLKRLSLADNTEIIEIKKELSLIEKMIKKVESKIFTLRAKLLLC